MALCTLAGPHRCCARIFGASSLTKSFGGIDSVMDGRTTSEPICLSRLTPPLLTDFHSRPPLAGQNWARARHHGGALAVVGLVLLFGSGDLQAQTPDLVCASNAPGDGEVIYCDETDAVNNTIDLNLNGVDIVNEREGQFGHGIYVDSSGDVTRTNISFIGDTVAMNGTITTDGDGIQVLKQDFGGGTGTITVDVKDSIFSTSGRAISVETDASAGVGNPNVKISASRTEITTEDALQGAVFGWMHGSGSGNVIIDLDDTSVTNGVGTPGTSNAHGVSGAIGSYGDTEAMGDIDIDISGHYIHNVDGDTIKTTTPGSSGVYAEHFATGDIYITVENAKVTTTGGPSSGNSPIPSVGVYGWHYGGGNTDISLTNTAVSTMGDLSHGVWVRVWDPDNASPQTASDVHISATGGSITTNGIRAHGVYGYMSQSTNTLEIELNNVEIRTEGVAPDPTSRIFATGIFGLHDGTGNLDIDVRGGSITTLGTGSHGIMGYHRGTHDTRSIDITVGGPVTTEGAMAQGVRIGGIATDDDGSFYLQGTEYPVGIAALATKDDEDKGRGKEGHRLHKVTVNGPVVSAAEGVFLANGGWVVIGPRGSIDSASGIAILATGSVPGPDNFEPAVGAIAPKLWVDLNLGGRRVAQALGDGWILNDGGETTIAMNNVVLHDGATGVTGRTAPNGAWDVRMQAGGVTVTDRSNADPAMWAVSARAAEVIADRDFSSVEDFTETERPVEMHQVDEVVEGGIHVMGDGEVHIGPQGSINAAQSRALLFWPPCPP